MRTAINDAGWHPNLRIEGFLCCEEIRTMVSINNIAVCNKRYVFSWR